ncbi:MAG: serine/threonine protein kinase [Myxococcaceae bacterium]|nr:serine/threonine protein kinase [Myxococcaceae bacterium]
MVPERKDNGLRVGPYELLTRLATGGMGEVFIARRTGAGAFEKKVALKLLLPHLVPDQEFVHRFFDEARLAARMNHPNVVQIFDVGESDGRPYLAMALVEGISLGRFLKVVRAKNVQLPLPIVRLIATGLLEGLAHAHTLKGTRGEELGVIHRDVTPSNLLLSTAGSVMLNDFGIAKAAINEHETRPGRMRGKYAYLAPEQAHRGRLTLRADLFSAAVTIYETLTLVSPFLHPGDVQTMEAIVKQVPASARTLRPDASEQMAKALERGLSKKPEDRFGSARQFREALVDGPVATAPELGELVQQLCGDQLRVFHRLEGGSASPGVAAPRPAPVSPAVAPPPRSRWKPLA